jgi:hypothetical protein
MLLIVMRIPFVTISPRIASFFVLTLLLDMV